MTEKLKEIRRKRDGKKEMNDKYFTEEGVSSSKRVQSFDEGQTNVRDWGGSSFLLPATTCDPACHSHSIAMTIIVLLRPGGGDKPVLVTNRTPPLYDANKRRR